MERAGGWRARKPLLAGLALVACALFYIVAIDPTLELWGDNAHYIIVARSIATGHGLRDLHTPGQPPFAFPLPLFPLALAPIVAVFDYALWPLKLFVAFIGVATVWCAYMLFRRLVDGPRAVALAVLTAVSPQIVSFSHQVMTEVPYLALSLVAIAWTMRYASGDARGGRAAWITVISLAAATLTRTIGVALVAAMVAYILADGSAPLGRRVQQAAIVGGVCALVWLAANLSILGNVPYVSEFIHGTASAKGAAPPMGIGSRVAHNVRSYLAALPETVDYSIYVAWDAGRPTRAVGWLVTALIGLGFVYAAWRQRSPIEYYVVLYAAVVLAYEPANSGNLRRYLVPVVPFALYYFARAFEAIGALAARLGHAPARVSARWRVAALIVLGCLVLANGARSVEASVLHRRPEMFDYYRFGDFAGYERMAAWARTHTPPASVISTRSTYIFHYFSRRQTVWLPAVEPGASDSAIAASIRAQRMTHVTTDSTSGSADSALFAVLARDTTDFVPIYARGRNRLYRVLSAPGSSP